MKKFFEFDAEKPMTIRKILKAAIGKNKRQKRRGLANFGTVRCN
jgi:hypothetical protein